MEKFIQVFQLLKSPSNSCPTVSIVKVLVSITLASSLPSSKLIQNQLHLLNLSLIRSIPMDLEFDHILSLENHILWLHLNFELDGLDLEVLIKEAHIKADPEVNYGDHYRREFLDYLVSAAEDFYNITLSEPEKNRFENSLWIVVSLRRASKGFVNTGDFLRLVHRFTCRFFEKKTGAIQEKN